MKLVCVVIYGSKLWLLGGGCVGLARFVKPLRDVGRNEADDAFNISVEMDEYVAPVAKHIDDDASPSSSR